MLNKNILISVFSSVMTVLLFMVLYSYLLSTEDEPGHAANDPARSFFQDSRMENTIQMLQQSIDNLLDRQQQLFKQNEALQQKVAQLESESTHQSGKMANAINKKSDILTSVNIDQEELGMAQENDLAMHFEVLKEEVLQEEYDSAWASEMDISLAEVEQRLKTLNIGNTSISSKECRFNSCLVEFTHEGDVNQSVLAGALAAAGTREVVLKHISENGSEKTVVIYRR